MTEQELHEKLTDILQMKLQELPLKPLGIIYKEAAEYLAVALIAEGMIFVDDKTVILPNRISEKTMIEKANLYEKMKHRAEVEEKTAREACGLVFSQEIDEEDWRSVIYEYKAKNKKYCNEVGITDDMLYNYLKEQVEKVLPKERENDK